MGFGSGVLKQGAYDFSIHEIYGARNQKPPILAVQTLGTASASVHATIRLQVLAEAARLEQQAKSLTEDLRAIGLS